MVHLREYTENEWVCENLRGRWEIWQKTFIVMMMVVSERGFFEEIQEDGRQTKLKTTNTTTTKYVWKELWTTAQMIAC